MPKSAADQLADAIARAERLGMTRYAIARASGVNKATVKHAAEHGVIPRLDTAQAIADAIGYTIEIKPRRR
ncbi:MAG: helix-turn-helix domain-containing protein [Phycisphaeraceae bacterium]